MKKTYSELIEYYENASPREIIADMYFDYKEEIDNLNNLGKQLVEENKDLKSSNIYLSKTCDKYKIELERLNKQIEEYQKALDETTGEKVDLHSIINKIRNYVYKPIDKEWDDILCIIEDGLKDSDK